MLATSRRIAKTLTSRMAKAAPCSNVRAMGFNPSRLIELDRLSMKARAAGFSIAPLFDAHDAPMTAVGTDCECPVGH